MPFTLPFRPLGVRGSIFAHRYPVGLPSGVTVLFPSGVAVMVGVRFPRGVRVGTGVSVAVTDPESGVTVSSSVMVEVTAMAEVGVMVEVGARVGDMVNSTAAVSVDNGVSVVTGGRVAVALGGGGGIGVFVGRGVGCTCCVGAMVGGAFGVAVGSRIVGAMVG